MKSFARKLVSWINDVGKILLHGKKTEDRIAAKIKSEIHLEELRKAAGTFHGLENDYEDKYVYRHMSSADKKVPKHMELSSFPTKDIYSCFGWQLHPYDIEKLATYIDNNPRLSRVKSNKALIGAAEADILILTSGSGKYHMDSFLCNLDTSKKIIIIASVRDLPSVQEDIKHRIDAHLNKLTPLSQTQFNDLIDNLIKKAVSHKSNTAKSVART